MPSALVTQELKLKPEENSISILATDNQGVVGLQTLRIRLNLPKPAAPLGPRLVVRSIGIENFKGSGIPPIPFAALDARKLADFLVAPAERKLFREDRIDARVFDGSGVSSGEIVKIFDRLAAEIKEHKLGAGDTVFLVIESHVLNFGPRGSLVLGADAEINNNDLSASVPALAISERLDEVASAGCLVLLLLDGIHEHMPAQLRMPLIGEWVRDLNKRGVLVLMASKQDPSQRLAEQGAFAQAILDSATLAGHAAAPGNSARGNSPTLEDFQAAVVNRVKELTGRKQFADFFPPEYLNWTDIRIFEPQRMPWKTWPSVKRAAGWTPQRFHRSVASPLSATRPAPKPAQFRRAGTRPLRIPERASSRSWTRRSPRFRGGPDSGTGATAPGS